MKILNLALICILVGCTKELPIQKYPIGTVVSHKSNLDIKMVVTNYGINGYRLDYIDKLGEHRVAFMREYELESVVER